MNKQVEDYLVSLFTHSDPCCHKHGCPCRLDEKGECKVCKAKLEKDKTK